MAISKTSERSRVLRKLLIPGMLGFMFGACIGAFGAGWIMVQKTVKEIQEPRVTSTVDSNQLSTTQSPDDYYGVINEIQRFIYQDFSTAISRLEEAMETVSNSLDQALAHSYLVFAYEIQGDHELAVAHYQQVRSLAQPSIDESSDPWDISRAFEYIVRSAVTVGDLDTAQQEYEAMRARIESLLGEINEAPKLARVYRNLIEAASEVMEYEDTEKYFSEMVTQLTSMLDNLATAEEIGLTYSQLVQASNIVGDSNRSETYNQALIDRLKPLRNGISDEKMLAKVNRYLGDAEFALGNYDFAAAYYYDLSQLEHSTYNVYLLASTYDLGGNYGCAFMWYQNVALVAENDTISVYTELYKEGAEAGLEHIREFADTIGGFPECQYR